MSCMRGCFVLPSTPGKRVCRPFRRKRVMHRAGAEAAGARRRDAAETPRDRVRAGAVCHAASGAAAAPRRGAVRADDAPAGPREQASEAGRHTRRSTVPTARCQDTTAVFGSSWQVILEVWHDKYTKNLRNNGRIRVKFDKWLVHIPFLCYLTILLISAEGAVYGGY